MWRRASGARIIVSLLLCISIGYGGHILALDTRSDPPQRPCWIANQRGQHMEIYSWFRAAIDSIVPFFIIFITNLFLINSVRNRKKALSVNDNNTDPSTAISIISEEIDDNVTEPKSEKTSGLEANDNEIELTANISAKSTEIESNRAKNKSVKIQDPKTITKQARHVQTGKQIITMLIFTSFAFLFLTLPWVVIFSLSIKYDYMQTPRTYAYFTFGRTCATTLVAMKATVNVFIYLATGSKFRRNAKDLFYRLFVFKNWNRSVEGD